jgi:hypothetical protein
MCEPCSSRAETSNYVGVSNDGNAITHRKRTYRSLDHSRKVLCAVHAELIIKLVTFPESILSTWATEVVGTDDHKHDSLLYFICNKIQ